LDATRRLLDRASGITRLTDLHELATKFLQEEYKTITPTNPVHDARYDGSEICEMDDPRNSGSAPDQFDYDWDDFDVDLHFEPN
jgi:hypothetical protein